MLIEEAQINPPSHSPGSQAHLSWARLVDQNEQRQLMASQAATQTPAAQNSGSSGINLQSTASADDLEFPSDKPALPRAAMRNNR